MAMKIHNESQILNSWKSDYSWFVYLQLIGRNRQHRITRILDWIAYMTTVKLLYSDNDDF